MVHHKMREAVLYRGYSKKDTAKKNPCPKCGAKPWYSCVIVRMPNSETPHEVPLKHVHRERKEAASVVA